MSANWNISDDYEFLSAVGRGNRGLTCGTDR